MIIIIVDSAGVLLVSVVLLLRYCLLSKTISETGWSVSPLTNKSVSQCRYIHVKSWTRDKMCLPSGDSSMAYVNIITSE